MNISRRRLIRGIGEAIIAGSTVPFLPRLLPVSGATLIGVDEDWDWDWDTLRAAMQEEIKRQQCLLNAEMARVQAELAATPVYLPKRFNGLSSLA